ncbi:hypothetical protein X975_26817, partial [Stegodyphus mimosarum]
MKSYFLRIRRQHSHIASPFSWDRTQIELPVLSSLNYSASRYFGRKREERNRAS